MSQCHHPTLNSTTLNFQSEFTLNVLQKTGINSSTIFSPISITFVLAMIYLGAKDQTAAQIRSTIAPGINEEEIHCHFSSILSFIKENNVNGAGFPNDLKKDKKVVENGLISIDWNVYNLFSLEFINQIYVQKNFTILESYKNNIKKYYNGNIENIDFVQSTAAVKKINDFVSKITKNKINDLIPDFSPDTKLVIINSIYFEAEWEPIIEDDDTYDTTFFSTEHKNRKIKMMKFKEDLEYFENDDYQIVGIPYKNCQFSMFIILPRGKFALEKVLKNFDASNLSKTQTVNVWVHFPRFKIESNFDVKNNLQNLGITDAFNKNANFEGISEEEFLGVSEFQQKAMIETNEFGTVAAAGSIAFIDHCLTESSETVYRVV
uniref:Serpin domain-containing protein n=1 Tax=Panagrolaimus davidi TaxID=227884 RepID=A0A914QU24_9BILA